jgi:hypothetical protein
MLTVLARGSTVLLAQRGNQQQGSGHVTQDKGSHSSINAHNVEYHPHEDRAQRSVVRIRPGGCGEVLDRSPGSAVISPSGALFYKGILRNDQTWGIFARGDILEEMVPLRIEDRCNMMVLMVGTRLPVTFPRAAHRDTAGASTTQNSFRTHLRSPQQSRGLNPASRSHVHKNSEVASEPGQIIASR